jgi:hypothetical protein
MAFVSLFRPNAGILLVAVLPLMAGRYCLAATSFLSGVQTGTVQNNSIDEASGIAASRMNPNVLWTHNDSGDSARVFAMTTTGTNLGTYSFSGAGAIDWEDIAVGPGPVLGSQYLYAADIGDNGGSRGSVSVYRVPEPVVSDSQSPVSTSLSGVARLTFAYPDGPRDAESMFVDPQTKDIYIISKRENPHHVYRAAYPQATGVTAMLELVATFADSDQFTAADISPGGDEIILRSYATSSGSLYVRPSGGSIADAFSTTPISIPLRSEVQGEAIGFDPNGWGYYTTSEYSNQPIYYFDRQPHGDYNHNGTVEAADYAVWRKGVGSVYQEGDYATWQANFGKVTPGAGASVELDPVPEPGAWVLVASCFAIFSLRMPRSY